MPHNRGMLFALAVAGTWACSMLMLMNFSVRRPQFELQQPRALEWLVELHATAEATLKGSCPREQQAFATHFGKLLERSACGADRIGKRGHVTADLGSNELGLYDVRHNPHGAGSGARSQVFADVVSAYFELEFATETQAPSELIHVTCTGYVSPSGAQRLVVNKGWGALTHVTHAYHMGCYAAFPAIRIAAGHLSVPPALRSCGGLPRAARVDIVHTELCTLHLDPSDHSAEQCVVQSLFADGFVRYSLCEMVGTTAQRGLELLAVSEQILPDSAACMAWSVGDFGMRMTLTRDVPNRIASALRPFVAELFAKARVDLADALRHAVVAVHPGGPKIIDRVSEVLELTPAQVRSSRDVLYEYGNMSSATLPHVWQRIVTDDAISTGTLIVSLAFGPGLTVCGALFRKH
ncbi:MAG TPA: 3-oxoacyl-[acyl-carrier-protein] synthase III C-terminal domain-containing protein [Polyangiaceae bacterium]|nr:3-oxoacyl-[acyl-carrier-protein] synthase III C-terminal domain-containing protein [Polyangiaceae bacterium]